MGVHLTINGKDARAEWGVVPTPNTLSALLAPAPAKEYVSNTSRLEDGARYDCTAVFVGERQLNLELMLVADSPEQFHQRHGAFCAELYRGKVDIETSDNPGVVYRTLYQSCTQFTQFNRGIATLSLRLVEPNPRNRAGQ